MHNIDNIGLAFGLLSFDIITLANGSRGMVRKEQTLENIIKLQPTKDSK